MPKKTHWIQAFCRRHVAAWAALWLALLSVTMPVAHAAAPAPGTVLSLTASARYLLSDGKLSEATVSTTASVVVLSVESMTLTQSQSATYSPGAPVTLNHVLTNTGNTVSTYRLDWTSGGTGCPVGVLPLTNMAVVLDANGNGVANSGEPTVALGVARALTLSPGQSVPLLAQANMPLANAGTSCGTLTVTADNTGVAVTNRDVLSIGRVAVLKLTQTANYTSPLMPGSSRIDYTVTGDNVGDQDATGTPTTPAGTAITVDGFARSMVLLRAEIPSNASFATASLSTSITNAIRLYRMPGDAPFAYRTNMDNQSAIEVAIGVLGPPVIPRGNNFVMRYAVVPAVNAVSGNVLVSAQAVYANGMGATASDSNINSASISSARVGVAEKATIPQANKDGTADVTFTVRVKNYGSGTLYDVKTSTVLEGAGAAQFGTYTTATSPAAGQYTVLAGSVKMLPSSGMPAGSSINVDTGYDGTAAHPGLLGSGTVLPPGGDVSLQFIVRYGTGGRTTPILSSTTATAAIAAGSTRTVSDDSVDGADPDPDGDGDPTNNKSSTSISTQLPQLSMSKTVSMPRRVASGVYDLDFLFTVTNGGSGTAPDVRIIDNLNCAFNMDKADGAVASWQLVGPVRVGNNILAPASTFTGNAPCDRTKWDSTDGSQFPTEQALSLTDGTRALTAGTTETVGFTVRVAVKASARGTRVSFTNRGWVVSLSGNAVNVDPSMVAGTSSSSTAGILVDPEGTVYDSVTRAPIAGAVVTITRGACSGGTPKAITADQVYNGNSGIYTFNADGSMSMTTGADGAWQFFWNSPPVLDKCTYSFSVKPPVGSAYVYPSERIPPTAGTFATCGFINRSEGPPAAGADTTYYTAVASGINADGSACEVFNNHFPLDPGLQGGLLLRKDGSKQQVEFGDFLDYALTLTNKSGARITGINFTDTLPGGFAYVPGSSRLNGQATADPTGGVGPVVTWRFPDMALAADQVVMVRYRVRVGVGARIGGTATNRAQVTATGFSSNTAEHTVRVNGGVFGDEAFAFGKVYMDCKRDSQQDGEDEPGVPGVRLWLEDGTNVITDGEGRWSLYGLKPLTHVLRLDETTLPAGAKVVIGGNRNAGTPWSRFVDLKKGEFHKANFPLEGCDDEATMSEIKTRREAAAKNLDNELSQALRTRLEAKPVVAVVTDARSGAASGQLNGTGGTGASLTSTSGPLIALGGRPAGPAQSGGNFLDGGTVGNTGTLATAQQTGVGVASGQVPAAGVGAGPRSQAPGQPGSVTDGLIPQPVTLSSIDLEKLVPDMDNKPGFVELRDGDTLPGAVINVRVKGPQGAQLRLSVNGESVGASRVGKRSELASRQVAAWEYIGVILKPGQNRLKLEIYDDMGNQRGEPVDIGVVAPDSLSVLRLDVPTDARADGRTAIPVTVLLTDAAGVPVTARTPITLETDAGRWVDEDLNPQEPGLQAFIEGGKRVFQLVPPGVPGDLRVRATVNGLVREARLALLAELRPMIAVGVVEGTLDLTKRGSLSVDQLPAGAAFEQELTSLGSDSDNRRAGGRAAFFLKGAIKGEYLLTAAFDSNKSSKDRLFRDIRPEEFYPIYGDASERGYDAQSSQKLYVRIDKNRSYLLYGDFQTASSTEVRKLSQTSRTLTGIKGVYDENGVRITSYASRTSQKQQIEEFAGKGISGPYYLSGTLGDMVENSEKVELLSRDRNQPSTILKTTALTRFVDYTMEPSTRRLMFVRPVSAVDTDLNPQSIRVTYEVDAGGPKYTVAGVDAQVRIGERVQAGVIRHIDQDPDNRRQLDAVTGLVRLGDNTSMAAEAVRTHSDTKGDGSASRIELRHQTSDYGISGQAARASDTFDNPAGGFSAGTTAATSRAEYRIDSTLAARAEAIYSKTTTQTEAARGQSVSLLKKFTDYFSAEVGLRHGAASGTSASLFSYDQVSSFTSSMGTGSGLSSSTSTSGSPTSDQNELTTVRARLVSTLPWVPQAQVFVEAEQDTKDSSKRLVAGGASYAITDKTRLYGRYEFTSTLYDSTSTTGTTASRNVGVFGVESSYMEGGRIYNEYRLAESDSTRIPQLASGVRQTIKLGDHWSVTGGLERTRALRDVATQSTNSTDATAVTSGVEYTNGRFRASGVLEKRTGSGTDTLLNSVGFGYRLTDEMSLLARSIYNSSIGNGTQAGSERIQSRQQIGFAYRPANDDRWNALARYEHKSERIRGTENTTGALPSDNSLPGDYDAHIVSAHISYSPTAADTVSGRLALKRSTYEDSLLKSSYSAQLLYGRWTRDLNAKWDMSVQGGLLHGSGGSLQKSLGLEVGYQVMKDLWFSVGYNVLGLSDRDLTAGEYTSRGAYLRLRFKFDETGLGFGRAGADRTAPPSLGNSVPSQPIEAPPRIAAPTEPAAPSGAAEPAEASVSAAPAAPAPSGSTAQEGGQ